MAQRNTPVKNKYYLPQMFMYRYIILR